MKDKPKTIIKRVRKGTTIGLPVVFLLLFALGLGACGNEQAISPQPTATRLISTPSPTKTPEPAVVRPTGIPEVQVTAPLPGDKILETEHFAFYVEDGYQPVDIVRFAGTAEAIYEVVSFRMGAGSPKPVILSFQPPDDGPCRPRGATFNDETGPQVTIFADDETEAAQIEGVLAHELAHVIHINGFDDMLTGDRNLTEGVATWITRDFWSKWLGMESLDEQMRDYLASGQYVPLDEADVFSAYPRRDAAKQEDCLARRDLLYTQWASFVGYLVNKYGWDSFLALMASAAPEVKDDGEVLPTPADYPGIYGMDLEALEKAWLTDLGP